MKDADPTTSNASVEGPTSRDEGNGHGHKAVRAAAIAAAGGAAALAAKTALSAREHSQARARENEFGSRRGKNSLVSSMVKSGLDAAKDSLAPFAEHAAGTAGAYVARNGPEILRDKLLPRFIRGFEQARNSDELEA